MTKDMRSQKPLNIVIVGLPGCGKGTQSEKIADKYNLKHVSSGEILREESKKDTLQAKKINDLMLKGTLFPDELLNAVFLDNVPKNNFILDGYPRKISQVDVINNINLVLYLFLNEQEAIERILHRKDERKDDNKETIKIRLDAFHKETEPVVDYYKSKGIYYEVNASGSPDEVFKKIVNIIDHIKGD